MVTSVPTAGVSLAEIPVFIAISRTAIRKLIQKAVAQVQREIAALLRKAAALLQRAGRKELAESVLARSQGTAFKGLMREVELADVRSPVNGANFYSGKLPDNTPMREVAEANVDGVDRITLEQTPGGKRFDDMQLFEKGSPVTKKQAHDIWEGLSRRYAENASGEATAWTHSSWSGSIWNTVEKPALENNPAVTKITINDPLP